MLSVKIICLASENLLYFSFRETMSFNKAKIIIVFCQQNIFRSKNKKNAENNISFHHEGFVFLLTHMLL